MEDYDKNGLLHEMFVHQAHATPDNVAVVEADGRQLTFAELDKLSNILATNLRIKGVVPDTCVGVYMDKCIEYVVAYIGILKAGGAYLPLDISYPDILLDSILQDAKPVAIVTEERLADRVKGKYSILFKIE